MLTIQLTNVDWTIALLTDIEKKQVPFALALGTNRTIEEAQAAIQAHEQKTYTIRRDWVIKGIKIDNADRATKDSPKATVHLDPARGFMSKFEEGDTKLPTGKSIAIPIGAKRSKSDIIQKSQRPKSFHFSRGYSSIRTGATIWRGDNRTWLLQRPDGTGTIFQRTGRGKRSSLKLLYILRPKAKTPANLAFYEVGEAVVRERYAINVQGFLQYALRTAK
jgi:hypothetical protein